MSPDYKARKLGLPTMPLKERLYSRVKVDPVSGCWEWQGSKRNGYGRITIGSRKDGSRKSVCAHRLSYILSKGDIPNGMEVCHKCDNPCCINPDHLFAGTGQDNVDDREAKHRNKVKIGEDQPRAKLSKEKVKEARDKKIFYNVPYEKLAKEYGVSKKTMQNAIKGKTWKCVEYFPKPPEEVRDDGTVSK